ncbi:MAG TPA: hypothetical protein VMM93_02965 [Vicinamibacterales bacterium]|nr:hypothetical protein [Vicinamibacterales bacterium]
MLVLLLVAALAWAGSLDAVRSGPSGTGRPTSGQTAGPPSDSQLAQQARSEAQRTFGDEAGNWTATRQPDGSVAVADPDGLKAVVARAVPENGAFRIDLVILERKGRLVESTRIVKAASGSMRTTFSEAMPGTRVVPVGAALANDPSPPQPTPHPQATPPSQEPPPPPPDSPPYIRFVPREGPPDSVALGQDFTVEVMIPVLQIRSETLDVTISNAEGDTESVTVRLDESGNGIAVYRSDTISIGGTRGDWRVLGPFGAGSVSLGGATTDGTITGLDLGNGDSISATVTLPIGTAGTSMQVFDTILDQALARGYAALFALQNELVAEQQMLTQAKALGLFTADQLPAIDMQLALNANVRTLLMAGHEAVRSTTVQYIQFLWLRGYLQKANDVYANGVNANSWHELLSNVESGIYREIDEWKNTPIVALGKGVALAFYNGATAIPFTSAGYTLGTSLFTTYENKSFSTGQTVWGTEATKGQWVWAWVEVAGQASMMRLYTNPTLGMNPFRDPGGKVHSFGALRLQLINPVERAVWNQAARLAERMVKPGASADELIAVHQKVYQQLGQLSQKVGLPHATRAYDALNDATRAGHAVHMGEILEATKAPRRLPPIQLPSGTPPPPPPVSVPKSSGWPAPPTSVAPPPPSVIFIDPLLLARNKIAHKPGLANVPAAQLLGTPAEQALLRQAVQYPGRVRVPTYDVNRGGVVPKPLTPDQFAWITGAPVPRTGLGTTQHGSVPFFAALGDSFSERLASDAATLNATGTGASIEEAAERAAWHTCDYPATPPPLSLDSSDDCDYWYEPAQDQPWTSFGAVGTSNTLYLGEAPPDWVDVWGADNPWRSVTPPEFTLLQEFLRSMETQRIVSAGDSERDQLIAALLRFRKITNVAPFVESRATGLGRAVAPSAFRAGDHAVPPFIPWLARSLRALIRSRDAAVEPASRAVIASDGAWLWIPGARHGTLPQANAPAPGLKIFFTSLGRSSGEALTMTAVNESRLPILVHAHALALRPLARLTARDVRQELSKLSGLPQVTVNIDAYCLNMKKLPPREGMVFGLADARTQSSMGPVHRIFEATERLLQKNAFTPDTRPLDYRHAVVQWAIWTVEQKFDERSYTRAFVEHSRKNVTDAGHAWTRELEQTIQSLAPGRWAAIQLVLHEAGLREQR